MKNMKNMKKQIIGFGSFLAVFLTMVVVGVVVVGAVNVQQYENKWAIDSTGQVGIGTTTPSVDLDIVDSVSSAQMILDGINKQIIQFNNNGSRMAWFEADYVSNRLEFRNDTGSNLVYLDYTGDAWFVGDVSALSFTDRTPSVANDYDALTDLKKVRSIDGKIDHDTLPDIVKGTEEKYIYDENDEIIDTEIIPTEIIPTRNIGMSVSVNVRAIQQLLDRIEALETRVAQLEK